ncbi:MAG: pitrilysin family protein [Anaerolineae bacterium]
MSSTTDRLFIRRRLDNGLTVLMRPSRAAPVTSFWIWYRVGSRNEPEGLTGASHWVEHMLFRGTPRFPRGAVHRLIAREGGIRNGMTSFDFTCYFETLPSDRVEIALEIEADRMVNAQFTSEAVEAERTIILSERAGSENRPMWRLHEAVNKAAFGSHPYGHPVIGWREDLERITRDQLYEHYRTYYAPNQAIVAIAGDFDPDRMLERVDAHFGGIDRSAGSRYDPPRPDPPQDLTRVTITGEERTRYVLIAFPAPSAAEEDYIPLLLADCVLGGAPAMALFGARAIPSRSSRLYRSVVEGDLAARASSNLRFSVDPSLFTISATARPDADPEQLEAALWREVDRITTEPITADELSRARRQLQAAFAYSSESVTNQAFWLGYSEAVVRAEWFSGFMDAVARVTADDILRVASKYLRRDRAVVGWYHPEGGDSRPLSAHPDAS